MIETATKKQTAQDMGLVDACVALAADTDKLAITVQASEAMAALRAAYQAEQGPARDGLALAWKTIVAREAAALEADGWRIPFDD